jgi:HTH-type transcriptional regulator/antitoxin HigA
MEDRMPAEVFPPGDFLKEELEARGWTQNDLADILDWPARLVSEIIDGQRRISPETALDLARAFGTSAEYWLNLESAYRQAPIRQP